MNDEKSIKLAIQKLYSITMKHKGRSEAALLVISAIPKVAKPNEGDDNLSAYIGGGGNPYAIADALMRRAKQDVNFAKFLQEILNGLKMAEHQ